MANIRQLDKRRKSVKNIRKITRTMELIATARFKKAMDRAAAATDYTKRITQIVTDLAESGTEVNHPLLVPRKEINKIDMLVLTANRGLCGGYNGNVVRVAAAQRAELKDQAARGELSVSGKRGISALRFMGMPIENTYTEFDDEPGFEPVSKIADDLIERYITGQVDRVDVVYTRFVSSSKQIATVETLLPFAKIETAVKSDDKPAGKTSGIRDDYEFLPSASPFWKKSFRLASGHGYSNAF